MESAGVVPNRVSFQHLVGLYASQGNISGASTVLQHMKNNDMPINENVFISLLRAHCAKQDEQSIQSTLQVRNHKKHFSIVLVLPTSPYS